jgi:hypothetical protein
MNKSEHPCLFSTYDGHYVIQACYRSRHHVCQMSCRLRHPLQYRLLSNQPYCQAFLIFFFHLSCFSNLDHDNSFLGDLDRINPCHDGYDHYGLDLGALDRCDPGLGGLAHDRPIDLLAYVTHDFRGSNHPLSDLSPDLCLSR